MKENAFAGSSLSNSKQEKRILSLSTKTGTSLERSEGANGEVHWASKCLL